METENENVFHSLLMYSIVLSIVFTRDLRDRWVSGWPAAQCAYSLLRKTPDIANRVQRPKRSTIIYGVAMERFGRCNL